MHEKIISEFLSLGSILDDTSLSKSLMYAEQIEQTSSDYLSQNAPPPPTNIKSKLKLFNKLFLFGSYYLQKYLKKVVSFFDYLMYLIEQADYM